MTNMRTSNLNLSTWDEFQNETVRSSGLAASNEQRGSVGGPSIEGSTGLCNCSVQVAFTTNAAVDSSTGGETQASFYENNCSTQCWMVLKYLSLLFLWCLTRNRVLCKAVTSQVAEGSLPGPNEPPTASYPKPIESNPHLIFWRPIVTPPSPNWCNPFMIYDHNTVLFICSLFEDHVRHSDYTEPNHMMIND
jgi:hypothetical protein